MPPQVGKAGGGTGPIVVPGTGGVDGPKSTDLQNKPAEQKQDSTTANKSVPYRATTKEASNRKAELSASATSQQTTLWQTMKNAGTVLANVSTAAGAAVGKISENVGKEIQQQNMEKLSKREYRQDKLRGEYFEVEKITPATTNKTQTRERVEDLSNGDSAARRYHPEQQRESTKSGLEDRLKDLNPGKELTSFEKKMVEEWDPKKKISLSPIKALDNTGTKGPVGVQGYRVERGESESKYRQVSYYDRDGNELLQGPSIQKQKMNKLAKSDHPQDMVPGEYFEAESITPGNKNETESSQRLDFTKARIQSKQERTSTKSGLEDRMKELNPGKELTPFEKKMVEEWDPNRKGDAVVSMSPIKSLDSTGTRGSTEVEGYKVVRGGTGDQRTTYYDRHGNDLMSKRRGGEAIPTDGPVDYISLARVGGKMVGKKIGERFAKKEAEAAAKVEANAAAKAEVNAATKVEANTAAKTETNTAAKGSSSSGQPDATTKSKGSEATGKPDKAGNKPSDVKDPKHDKDPAETTKRSDVKGTNASKTSRMSRPKDEIDKEIKEAQGELGEVTAAARKHVRGMTKDGEVPLGGKTLEDQLRKLAADGDEVAWQLLRELDEVKKRLRNLHREKGVLGGDPEHLP